jgi:hypothetical protein
MAIGREPERYGDVCLSDVPAGWAPTAMDIGGGSSRVAGRGLTTSHGGSRLSITAVGSFSMTAGPGCLLTKRSVSPVLPIYAPALATFFATQNACAWVPLGPGEVYVIAYLRIISVRSMPPM